ncbi:MAG: hypothetical protein H6636_02540 [Anaerolineales bacterium]|nr:hypothetical protein [Anaerolineales bacterium]
MSKIRPFTLDEQLTLTYWKATDDLNIYLITRILLLAQKNWYITDIALALSLKEEQVLHVIHLFNQYGLPPFIPGIDESPEIWTSSPREMITPYWQENLVIS